MKPAVVIQTDFTKGIAVCTMYGVINSIDDELNIYDACHDIESFNTYQASVSLGYFVPFWKPGTIFVSVVDPGVGTDRRACIALLKNGSYVVTPDNGSLTHMKRDIGIVSVREIDENRNRLETTKEISIFHGRDLFAYCAGRLASRIITYEEVGREYDVEEIVEHNIVSPKYENGVLSGMIQSSSPNFGLVNSNIPYKMLEDLGITYGDSVRASIRYRGKEVFGEIITYQPSFGYVKEGCPLVMISETKHLQIAKNLSNITVEYNISSGPDWTMEFKLL